MKVKFLVAFALALIGSLVTSTKTRANDSQQDENCPIGYPVKPETPPNGQWDYGVVTPFQPFGHTGSDWMRPKGTPVYATGNGVVTWASWWPTETQTSGQGHGPTVWLKHQNCSTASNLSSVYAHLDLKSITVKVGDKVTKGQLIGYVGADGKSGAGLNSHVHYAIARGDVWMNPHDFLKPSSGNKPDNAIRPTVFFTPPEYEWWEKLLINPKTQRLVNGLTLTIVGVIAVLFFIQLFFSKASVKQKSVNLIEKVVQAGIVLLTIVIAVGISKGRIWSSDNLAIAYVADDPRMIQAASFVGYKDTTLFAAFHRVAVPRGPNGEPVEEGGAIFPPSAAAAIPFGETNAEDWATTVDPTTPGPWGNHVAWYAVAIRWPPSLYEKYVLGMKISQTAQQQRDGLTAISDYLNGSGLPQKLGRANIKPWEIIGSSSGAVGRTQILPSYFASEGLCGDAQKDVWNDSVAVAECTTRHLVVNGCWGSWAQNGDVWSALCGYNPGAWDNPNHQWYWDTLKERMEKIQEAEVKFNLTTTTQYQPASETEQTGQDLTTPIAGLEFTRDLIITQRGGQSNKSLEWKGQAESWLVQNLPEDRLVLVYRFFRLWVVLTHTTEEINHYGITP